MKSSVEKANDLLRLAAGEGREAESAARQLGKLAKKDGLVVVSAEENALMEHQIEALRQAVAALTAWKIEKERERPWWNPERVSLPR